MIRIQAYNKSLHALSANKIMGILQGPEWRYKVPINPLNPLPNPHKAQYIVYIISIGKGLGLGLGL